MPTYWGQVDVARATQDYMPFGGCVRLVAVEEPSYRGEEFNAPRGCATYLIDLGFKDLLETLESSDGFSPGSYRNNHTALLDYLGQLAPHLWLQIDYEFAPNQSTSTYAYEIFAGSEPNYLSVNRVRLQAGKTVTPAPTALALPALATHKSWKLVAFHVGQGMCSLLTEVNNLERCLLDAGAGTPVRRHAYMTGGLINELASIYAVTSTPKLSVFVSHPDSDHWRLLDWDSKLFANVDGIYVPDRTPNLAFKSPHAIGKTWSMGSLTRTFDASGGRLELYRSQPAMSDRNGECLVAIVKLGSKQALLSGDYVYSRMAVDGDSNISAVVTMDWDAIVVPHHGDSASANQVPGAVQAHKSKAFFSAGTHAGYGHPKTVSINAHKVSFDVIDQHALTDIKEHQLL